MKQILLIENAADLQHIVNELPVKLAGHLIVCPERYVPTLKERGLTCVSYGQILMEHGEPLILNDAVDLMAHWYVFNGLTSYHGTDFGCLFSSDFYTFEPFVRTVRLVGNILNDMRPQHLRVPNRMLPLARDAAETLGFDDVLVDGYKLTGIHAIADRVKGNPYIGFLLRPRGIGQTIRDIRDYLWRYPCEFCANSHGRLADADIIFSVSHASNIHVAAGPIHELKRRGWRVLILVQDMDGGNVLKRMDHYGLRNYSRIGGLVGPNQRAHYRRLRAEFSRRWEQALTSGLGDSLVYRGVRVLRHVGMAKLRWITTRLIPYYIVLHEVVRSLISDTNCKAVVAMNDIIAPGRVVAMAANHMRVPSFDIQHGYLNRLNHAKQTSGKWLLWGEADRSLLLEMGAPEAALHITGNPAYDTWRTEAFDVRRARHSAALPDEFACVISWFPTYVNLFNPSLQLNNRQILRLLVGHALSCPHCMFLVKPHPLDSEFRHLGRINLPSNMKLLPASFPVEDALRMSTVVMSWNSTILRDAIVMDRPIIGLNLYPLPEAFPITSEGVAIEVRSIEQFTRVLPRLIDPESPESRAMRDARNVYVSRYFHKLDGMAASRVADAIEKGIMDGPRIHPRLPRDHTPEPAP